MLTALFIECYNKLKYYNVYARVTNFLAYSKERICLKMTFLNTFADK